jgi:membrane protein
LWADVTRRLRVVVRRVQTHWMVRGYQATNAGYLVAIVAFNALVAFVPTLLLLIALAGVALRDPTALTATVQAIEATLPTPDARTALDAVLSVRQSSGWFGLLSLLGFCWIGANFADALAHCFNQIYGVADCGYVCARRKGVGVVIGSAGLLLLAGPAASLATWLLSIDGGHIPIVGALAPDIGYGTAFLAATAFFLLLYRVLPNAGQRLRDVWPGALVAAALFVLLGQVFPLYLRLTGGANRFGAAFGLVWLLVTWLAAFAHLLLFGAYVNARRQRRLQGGPTLQSRPSPIRPPRAARSRPSMPGDDAALRAGSRTRRTNPARHG